MFRPFFLQESLLNGYKFVYTFQSDFDIADHFGTEAVKDTFNRAFNEWKSDIIAVSEIECVLNLRCWFWYELGNEELSRLYSDLFYKVRDYVYGDDENGSPFSDEELRTHFEITD